MAEAFKKSAADVKKLKSKPSDQELLDLYGLFKQVTAGDNTSDRPGILDLKGKAKFDAWASKKGVSKEEAEKQYVDLANKMIDKYGLA